MRSASVGRDEGQESAPPGASVGLEAGRWETLRTLSLSPSRQRQRSEVSQLPPSSFQRLVLLPPPAGWRLAGETLRPWDGPDRATPVAPEVEQQRRARGHARLRLAAVAARWQGQAIDAAIEARNALRQYRSGSRHVVEPSRGRRAPRREEARCRTAPAILREQVYALTAIVAIGKSAPVDQARPVFSFGTTPISRGWRWKLSGPPTVRIPHPQR
jgi:hypothetical protein